MDKIYKKYQGHTIENGFSETSPDFKISKSLQAM